MVDFVISDTHFGHAGVCKFLRNDGSKLRPWGCPDEMTRDMIAMWNAVVSPSDKVFHLGDVVINRRCLPVLDQLNGQKILIKGNHDVFRLDEYVPRFSDVKAYHVYNDYLMCHIPVHPHAKDRFKGNIHGHLHSEQLNDPWYINVSVEQIGYKPARLIDVLASS